MSRKIDEDAPLSDADRAFLMTNGQENRVRAHDERLGVAAASPTYLTGLEPSLLTGTPANGLHNAPGLSSQQFTAAVGDIGTFLGALSTEALADELNRREAAAEGDEDEVAEASLALSELVREIEEDVPDYEDWKLATIKGQLGVRELNKSGNKDALIKRLREDDNDNA